MKRQVLIIVCVGAVAAMSLTGCAPVPVGPIADSTVTPPDASMFIGDTYAFVDDSKLYLLLSGSSSCPPTPTSAQENSDDTATIILERTAWPFCTADMKSVTYEIPVASVPESVILRSEGTDSAVIEVLSD